MSVIDEIAIARFNKTDDPHDLRPGDALEAARRFLQANPETEHVIVIVGRTMENGSSGTNFFNAGKYAHHAVMGLCLEGMHMVRESG